MILNNTTSTVAEDEHMIQHIAKLNPQQLCFTYVFGGLIVLSLGKQSDLNLHNRLLENYDDNGNGMRYFYKHTEII